MSVEGSSNTTVYLPEQEERVSENDSSPRRGDPSKRELEKPERNERSRNSEAEKARRSGYDRSEQYDRRRDQYDRKERSYPSDRRDRRDEPYKRDTSTSRTGIGVGSGKREDYQNPTNTQSQIQEKRKLLWGNKKQEENVGNWEGVQFENTSRTDKFYALMGARKKTDQNAPPKPAAEAYDPLAPSVEEASTPVQQQKKIFDDLEKQFHDSVNRKLSTGHKGLG